MSLTIGTEEGGMRGLKPNQLKDVGFGLFPSFIFVLSREGCFRPSLYYCKGRSGALDGG